MANEETLAVKDVIYKLQTHLLEGIKHENQLFTAGSLLSRGDYMDVVFERSITDTCGYPLCSNPLPSERPRKGRYRISLKEHRVYDLRETYMYCSTDCVVNSQTFAGSLKDERCSELDQNKLSEILKIFEGLSLDCSTVAVRGNKSLRLPELKIEEKKDVKGGEVSLEEWIGPSNAIEGYVPRIDLSVKPPISKNLKKGSKDKHSKHNDEINRIISEIDFTSTIITQDEYSVSKSPGPAKNVLNGKFKGVCHEDRDDDVDILGKQVDYLQLQPREEIEQSDKPSRSHKGRNEDTSLLGREVDSSHMHSGEEIHQSDKHNISSKSDDFNHNKSIEVQIMSDDGRESASNGGVLKSSLKSSSTKKVARSVTWADEKVDAAGKTIGTSSEKSEHGNHSSGMSTKVDMKEDDYSYRFASAELCAEALSQAADSVASGSDVSDAVSEAGIIILPPPQEVDEAGSEDDEVLDTERTPPKWPRKPGVPEYDVFHSEDSWYDNPPDGFNLTLSPFALMFNSLFAWMTSSSLAFIYGHDESASEEYLYIGGREYPHKIVSSDGRSTEIRETLARCLAQALPGLVANMRLRLPVSHVESGLSRLIDTMSFVDPLPAFRVKQWQLIALLLLDALSVCRIPSLAPYMTGRRTWLLKVLEGSQISVEEYEIMKDLVIPLGRVPQFSVQSGG